MYPNPYQLYKILAFDINDKIMFHNKNGGFHYHLYMWDTSLMTYSGTCFKGLVSNDGILLYNKFNDEIIIAVSYESSIRT